MAYRAHAGIDNLALQLRELILYEARNAYLAHETSSFCLSPEFISVSQNFSILGTDTSRFLPYRADFKMPEFMSSYILVRPKPVIWQAPVIEVISALQFWLEGWFAGP